ncbi:hypothetical protein Mjas_04260 [Methanothermococcus sp. Ax23]|uniref:hypothetical protein n=1 Tax=Methanothermococcus sp. Ax23 TaxID=3156486 RepID=UPI003BA3279D
MIGNLEYIINKSIVVDTYSPENFMEKPDEIYANYEKYLSTYIQVGSSDFDKRFVREIKKGKTVKGYISAPYGYGKTSKALSLWNFCKENNILAVPPFKFDGKLDSIMDAVYGWTRYVFKHKYPEYLNTIEEIHLKYRAEGREKVIRDLQQKKRLTRNEAEDIINELSDNLVIGITPKILMRFLKEINGIIKENFEGLAIFVDEVQGITSTNTINELRNFVFELGTYNEGIGILFIIPDYQEEELATRAGDLIDRLKKDEFYLNLINIYTNTFAENLWKIYGEKFGFEPYDIITKDCLRSIGEVSSKEHLGRGPRTVINAFKRACTIYKDTMNSYDVLDFVNDVLNNKVEYVQPKYVEELNRALSLNEINSEEKRNVIKFLGAFPNGISEDKIKAYGLWNAFEELQKKLYGTIIKYTIEGYSLEGLEHGDSNDFITQQIIKFRTHFAENEMYEGDMTDAFLKYLMPEIFPRRRGNQIFGWTYKDDTPIPNGHFIFLEGTFNPKYPNRFVETYVVRKELNEKSKSFVERLVGKAGDISYEFVLDVGNHGDISNTDDLRIDYNAGHVVFKFDMLKKVAEHELPGDLKILQNYVKPQDVNPMFMLCLLKHLDNLEENSEIYTKFEGEIKSLKSLLVRYLKRFLFSDELKNKHNLSKNYEKMVEEIFTKLCVMKYPCYHTLIHSVNYHRDLDRYRSYLKKLPISKRRGEPIESTKRELVGELTGSRNPSVSGFYDECKSGKWKNLIKIIYWGRDDRVEFNLTMHPLEKDIWDTFKNKFDTFGSVKWDEIEEYAFGKGYLIDEIEDVIKLLESRGYIKYDEDNDILIKQRQISNVDVLNKFEEVVNMAGYVAKICREYGETPNLSINFNLKNEIKNEHNEDKLHGYMDRINDWERGINVEFRRITERLNNDKTNMLERINKTIAELNRIKTKIDEEGKASITCSSLASIIDHINRIPTNLKRECQNSIREAKELKESIEYSGGDFAELAKRLKGAKTKLNDIKKNQDNIINKYNKWQTWKELIGYMEDIFRNIDEYKEHLDIEEENSKFENLIYEIQHGFAQYKEKYLFNDELIKSKINQISTSIKNKERLLKEGFITKKGDVEAILNSIIRDSELLNCKPIRYNIAFSIEDRDTSYQNLNDSIKEDMKNFISSYEDYIVDIKTKIDMKIENESEKDELYNKLHKIEEKLDGLKSTLFELDIIEGLDDIKGMKENLIELGREIKEIDKDVKRRSSVFEPTEEEKESLKY